METKVRGFAHILTIAGVPVLVHWSVVVITVLLVATAVTQALYTLYAIAAYLGLLLLHEWGHLVAARRRGYGVWTIELYPLHGWTRVDAPRTQFDACVVAWGGVAAQAAVAVPLILYTAIFGWPPFGPINALLAVFGYLSVVIAIYNLVPVGRLDGVLAWQIVPLLWRRWRRSRRRRHPGQASGRKGGGWVN